MDEGTQANITAFFDGTVGVGAAAHANGARGEGFAPRKRADGSKRMGSALKRMADRARTKQGGSTADDVTGEIPEQSNVASSAKAAAPKAGKRRKESARANVAPDEQSGSDDDDASYNETSQRQQPAKKRTRTSRAKK
jgi:DNA excision repair protein ERCC-5